MKFRRLVPLEGTPQELQSGAAITIESAAMPITTHRQSLKWSKRSSSRSQRGKKYWPAFEATHAVRLQESCRF